MYRPVGDDAAGTTGSNGKLVIGVAVLGAICSYARAHVGSLLFAVVALAFGIYERAHISGEGVHVGWGVYAVIVGAAFVLAVLASRRLRA